MLPGTVYSLIESSVYAQVGGYIKAWHYDIGAKVKAGDLLAEIDTPVTDQQLRQAQENVKQAEANLNLAKITSARYNDLLQRNAVAQQDADNQNAQEKVQEANLSAAQAFEQGIERTEDFKQVRAPLRRRDHLAARRRRRLRHRDRPDPDAEQ
ncbi:MAG: biotin/lipoyl-binding protein [Verrucomicrobiota bacterium]